MGERTPTWTRPPGRVLRPSAMHTKLDLAAGRDGGRDLLPAGQREILRGMGVELREMLACGGGGTSPLWRQMLADTLTAR